jgi:uncharacterized membrane protein
MTIPWEQVHGAMTHFPIALLLFSTGCDFGSLVLGEQLRRELRRVSFYGLIAAALGSLGAVVSGIAITQGDLWGRGDMLRHHQFIWPAFTLLIALSIWRLIVRDRVSRVGLWIYLALMGLASGLMAAAGYFGGELILRGG